MSDPMAALTDDHRDTGSLIAQVAESEPGLEREELLEQLRFELHLHMDIEEEFIYPLISEWSSMAEAEEGSLQHELVREALARAQELSQGPGFAAAISMLAAAQQHHVSQEESRIIPRLKDRLDTLTWADLGSEITQLTWEARAARRSGSANRSAPSLIGR